MEPIDVDKRDRLAANEEAVQSFFARWDPSWRWILLLGLRQLRTDPVALGTLASAEANGHPSWADESYAYGPLTFGLTAAAVNEAVQHCEDLFALLKFMHEPAFFAREMANYGAGKVTSFGRGLASADDATISRLFLVPDDRTVRQGFRRAEDPEASIGHFGEGRTQLATLVRDTAAFYEQYEAFHVHYKHGLKLPFRPFGEPTKEAIDERKESVKAPLFLWTNEPIKAMLARSAGAEPMMFFLGPRQQANLSALVEERNVLRLRLLHEVDLDDLVARSYTVLRLLQLAAANRVALGRVEDGLQTVALPGRQRWEQMDLQLELERPLALADFKS